ncbi:Predicted thioesterase [Tindallia magadiensis]|uniref:Predicted thioesterase n=1 Tax=Tindallia magadiensis TaxID=69895 RepID=A0A1I3ATA0_9FIRM|nr:hypothetical protein [Tindallia magadiensis]SFH53243.1 Predicted thioesterase [Tindallia magadiensis]
MHEDFTLSEGLEYCVQKRVAYEDTTVSFGRAGIETLFSTTALVGMMIEAAVELVGKNVPEGFITVGKKIEITHEKPTLQGMQVTVKAKLDRIEGSALHFEMTCYDEIGEIAKGKQERYLVNKDALIKRAHERAQALEDLNR